MMLKNNEQRYGAVAQAFHWGIAAAILSNVALAFYFNSVLDHHDPERLWLTQWHKSIGLTVLILSVARLLWRLINSVPSLPENMSTRSKRLAHTTHWLLYLLMILVPLLGWGLASASRTALPTYYFGLFVWPNIGVIANSTRANKQMYGHMMGQAHEWLGYMMLFLALGHIAAALLHHFGRRDLVLRRMLPGCA